jgi:hypothetical protein
MLTKLLDILLPLKSIAQELRHIRQLYELELSERTPPIILPSQAPSRYDTEVITDELGDRPKSALTKIKEKLFPQEIDDEEFDGMRDAGPFSGDARPESASGPGRSNQDHPSDPEGSGRE